MAVSYAGELARWNIETTIIVPGAFTSGTNHFANAGKPADSSRLAEYAPGPTATLGDEIMQAFARTAVADADVADVANAIVRVLDTPFGKQPFRVHIDPANDGAEVVNGVADRVRAELLRNMGLADLLKPSEYKGSMSVSWVGGTQRHSRQDRQPQPPGCIVGYSVKSATAALGSRGPLNRSPGRSPIPSLLPILVRSYEKNLKRTERT